MLLIREDDGTFRLEPDPRERVGPSVPVDYADALIRYLALLDPIFVRARERSEFQFILALLRVRGVEDAGWDPYETSVAAMRSMLALASGVRDFESRRHVHLWIYGHLVEASEPYEIVRNMLGISQGEPFNPWCFPPVKKRPQSPEAKIGKIEAFAKTAAAPEAAVPLRERWDRDLRNAIFHADYSLFGGEIRLRWTRIYSNDDFFLLLNRAKACHDAIFRLQEMHRQSYDTPRLVAVPPEFKADRSAVGQVIVRDGEGLAAIRAAWNSPPKPGEGERINWHLGRFYPGETDMLEADPDLLVLPRPGWVSRGRPATWCPE